MKEESKPALDLLEEAAHVLRDAPAAALAAYFAGSVPFVLFFLYYWADMSSAASAFSDLLDDSLLLTFLYIWMKTWQTVFVWLIRDRLERGSGKEVARNLGTKRWLRIALVQAVIQPSALFLLLPSFLILL